MIKVENLYHRYKGAQRDALVDVNFEVQDGEIFGFLGPSGAGKSTTQAILTGLLQLQKGSVQVAGFDMQKPPRQMFNTIGMSFEQSNVYSKLTARENLSFYAKLFDVETRDPMELIELVGLKGKENTYAGAFSKGMKHRLTFARSMLNNPKLWFLDEPTTGLDPAIAATIKKIIREQNDQGVTVFLTTHNMFIAEELCDRVAFIIDGEIKLIDAPRNLKLAYGDQLVDIEYLDGDTKKQGRFSLKNEEQKQALAHIVARHHIITMHTKEATLEEIFIEVTGRELIG